MGKITYKVGDATNPPDDGIVIIAHVCNNIGAWGAGFVVPLGARYPTSQKSYLKWAKDKTFRPKGTDDAIAFELGQVQFVKVADRRYVANMVAQNGVRGKKNHIPLRYEALAQCLGDPKRSVGTYGANGFAEKAVIHMPRIGCGLAGGTWDKVGAVVQETLVDRYDLDVVVWDLPEQ